MSGEVQEGLCAGQEGALLAACRGLPLLVLSFPQPRALLALMLSSALGLVTQI